MMAATFDDLLVQIGGFGKFQIRTFLLGTLIIFLPSFVTYMPIFILTVPKHRCALEDMPNDTYQVQSSAHWMQINSSIPEDVETGELSSCYHYVLRATDVANQTNGPEPAKNQTGSHMSKCHRWVYDKTLFDRTLIEEFNIVCDHQHYRTHANMALMLGKVTCVFLQGCLSDRIGRKRCIIVFVLLSLVGGVAHIFIFNIATLILCRFLSGLSGAALFLASYVFVLEFLAPAHRQLVGICMNSFWCFTGVLLTGMAYFARDHQHLSIIFIVSNVPFLLYYWFLSESPRWLLTQGRVREGKEIMAKIAATNGKPFPHDYFREVIVTEFHIQDTGTKDSVREVLEIGEENTVKVQKPRQEYLSTLLRHKKLAFIFAILIYSWFINGMVYNAMLFNVSNQAGSVYLNFLLFSCVDIVSLWISYFLLNRIGRKISYMGFLCLGSLFCLVVIVPPLVTDHPTTIVNVLLLLGRAGVVNSYNIIYLLTAEIFPTTVRSQVMSCGGFSSRGASILAPYIADLGMYIGGYVGQAMPLLICGGTGLLAVLFAIFLPETVGRILPNNIEEAKALQKGLVSKKPVTPRKTLQSQA